MHRQEFTHPNHVRSSRLVHSSWKGQHVVNEADLLGWVHHDFPDFSGMRQLRVGRWTIAEYVVAALDVQKVPMGEVVGLIEFLTERALKAERIISRTPSKFMHLVCGVADGWKLARAGHSEVDFALMYAGISDLPAEEEVKTRVRRRPAPFELKVPIRRRRIAIYD